MTLCGIYRVLPALAMRMKMLPLVLLATILGCCDGQHCKEAWAEKGVVECGTCTHKKALYGGQ